MSFLNSRVSPELLSSNAAFETELTDWLSHDKVTGVTNNDKEVETSITDCRSAKKCQDSPQEGLDDIPEEHKCFTSNQFQEQKPTRPGGHYPKRLSWNTEGASPNLPKRFHGCDRIVLLTVCVLSAASVVLTLLMLFGIVGPLNCDCSGKTGSSTSVPNADDYTKLSKNVQDLKQNVSSLKEFRPELEEMRKKYDELRKKYEEMKTEVIEPKGKNLSAESNKSESYSDKDNMTALWQAIQTNRQEIIQMDQKDNISALRQSVQTIKQEIIQLDQKDNITALWQAIKTNRQEIIQLDQKDNISALSQAIQTNRQEIIQLDEKMINVSKTQGPRGPPGPSGYNGTQGPPGVAGPSGSPGPSGSGNLSLCSYKEVKGTPTSAGAYASTDATAVETKGKKFLGVNCGTNDASIILFSTSVSSDGLRSYTCNCKNTVSSGAGTMDCYIRYWECPT